MPLQAKSSSFVKITLMVTAKFWLNSLVQSVKCLKWLWPVFLPFPLAAFPHRFVQAFAWWTDLMVEHAENFLSLYAVDMDAALEIQSPESWDSFPLFQLLNDFLRLDCEQPDPFVFWQSNTYWCCIFYSKKWMLQSLCKEPFHIWSYFSL